MPKRTAFLLLALLLLPAPCAAQRIRLSVPLDDLVAAAKADSNDATAHYNLAIGYWSKGRWEDAGRSLDECLALDPRFALAHLARAYLPFARRPKLWKEIEKDEIPTAELATLQEMQRDYRRAFFFNPLVDLRIVGAVVPAKSYLWDADPYLSAIYDTWIRAFEDFRDANYAAALRRFERMADAYTATGKSRLSRIPTEILWYRGLSAAQLGMHEDAIRDVREVLSRAEEKALEKQDRREAGVPVFNPLGANEYRYVLGVLLLRAQQFEEARDHLGTAAEQDLGLYMAHVNLAHSLEQEQRWHEAVVARRAAVSANPEDPTSSVELAVSLSKIGGRSEVEEILEEVARTHPRHPRAHYLLGLVKHQLGKREEARSALEHFVGIAPSRSKAELADATRRLAEL